ncbi:Gfo/Idh/MocA family oxidoreductase [bacterium]|nr:Gfo/Idh/MocA family oxidoreductase [bacterium]
MRIGIISFANKRAYEYAECIKELGLNLIGIADDEEKRGKEAAEKFEIGFYPKKEDLLSQKLDAVLICSENAKHKEDIVLSAEACKNIICEMPLATTLDDAKNILSACEERKASLFLALPYRYSPPLVRAKEILKEGKIGEVLAVKATHRSKVPSGWQVKKALAGGGAILQNAPAMIDVMRWFTEDEIVEVYAEFNKSAYSEIEVEDIATLSLRFSKGAFATLDPSWCLPPSYPFGGDATIELIGKEGALLVNAFAQVLSYIDEKGKRYNWEYWGSPLNKLMLKEYIGHIERGEGAPISPLEGLKALEVALKGYISKERKEPLTI